MTEAGKTVAIVTGAGGDIGRAIAKVLRNAGHVVVAADLDSKSAEAAAAELGTFVHPCQCDVTDPASVEKMVNDARRHGKIAVLVNNAGGITGASLNETTPQDWHRDSQLNLNAAFYCFKAVVEDLKTSKGCVVNTASVNGFGVFGHPGYSASKAGLIHLTKLIAVEYGKSGIRANAVAPGTVRTQAWEQRAAANPEIFEDVNRWYPLQRIATADDVANAVGFLASDAASAITGTCLPVDCGLTAGQTELAHTFSQSPDY